MNLHFLVHRDDEGWLIAECPALPGCVTQAQNEMELLGNMREAAMAWLAAEDARALEESLRTAVDVSTLVITI